MCRLCIECELLKNLLEVWQCFILGPNLLFLFHLVDFHLLIWINRPLMNWNALVAEVRLALCAPSVSLLNLRRTQINGAPTSITCSLVFASVAQMSVRRASPDDQFVAILTSRAFEAQVSITHVRARIIPALTCNVSGLTPIAIDVISTGLTSFTVSSSTRFSLTLIVFLTLWPSKHFLGW